MSVCLACILLLAAALPAAASATVNPDEYVGIGAPLLYTLNCPTCAEDGFVGVRAGVERVTGDVLLVGPNTAPSAKTTCGGGARVIRPVLVANTAPSSTSRIRIS